MKETWAVRKTWPAWTHGQVTVADAGTAQPLVKESLTGTLTFTNADDQVTGAGTLFTTELEAGDFISLDADELWVEVESIESNTALTLTVVYAGTGGAGAGSTVGSVEVPDGCQITVIARTGNAGYIYLGKSKAEAEDTDNRFDGLMAGLAHSLNVTNANLVWVDASSDGEGASYSVEQPA